MKHFRTRKYIGKNLNLKTQEELKDILGVIRVYDYTDYIYEDNQSWVILLDDHADIVAIYKN